MMTLRGINETRKRLYYATGLNQINQHNVNFKTQLVKICAILAFVNVYGFAFLYFLL